MKDLSSSRDSYRMSSLSSSSARRYNDYDDPRGGSTEDELYRRRLLKVRQKRYFGLMRPFKLVPKILIDYSFPHVRRSKTFKADVNSTSVGRSYQRCIGVGEIAFYSFMAYA